MRRALSILCCLLLQIAWLPLSLLGAAMVSWFQFVVSWRLGVSMTAIEVLNGRWVMHFFGLRADEATDRLMRVTPNASRRGMWLALFPLWAQYRLSGRYFAFPRLVRPGDERLADLMTMRTLYFDRAIEEAPESVRQLVVLGGGFDTRAYRYGRPGLRVFEVDRLRTQQHKLACLERGGVNTRGVVFVSADFATESALDRLEASGLDPALQTVFIWEGVTLYLAEEEVRSMLRSIATRMAPGSVIALDLYGEQFLRLGQWPLVKQLLELTGEGFDFGLALAEDPEGSLRALAESEGLTVGHASYLGRARRRGTYCVVAELRVGRTAFS